MILSFIEAVRNMIIQVGEGAAPVAAQPSIANPNDQQIVEFAKTLAQAVMSKNYLIVAGIGLMFVVLLFNKIIIPKLSETDKYKQYIPLITFCISLIAGVATWILNPSMNLVEILTAVIGTTMVAAGSWEAVMKPIWNIIGGIIKKGTEAKKIVDAKIEEVKDKIDVPKKDS